MKSSQGLIGPRSTARSRQAVLICLKEQEDFCYILCQVQTRRSVLFPKTLVNAALQADLHRNHSTTVFTCCHSVKQLTDVLTRRSFSELFPSLPPSSLKTFDDRRAKTVSRASDGAADSRAADAEVLVKFNKWSVSSTVAGFYLRWDRLNSESVNSLRRQLLQIRASGELRVRMMTLRC